MLRYDLDKLGWYEFEGLVQALLKARLGMGIEAWGGSSDLGRDAYYAGALKYPTVEASTGPFVFQCKFVSGANAAGARPGSSVRTAVEAECKAIASRMTPSRWKPVAWSPAPTHYALLTNACVGAAQRREIDLAIKRVLPAAVVHVHDGQDVCAWLDGSPEIVRAFPLLWGLREIGDLLRQWVHADLITRSKVALAESRDIAKVFVPTRIYSQALDVVNRHHFVVLEGPPEMGKTAIGRMIALSQLARGWDAVECRIPNDIEKVHESSRSQVFVVDDFFGRTEYEPRRVSDWQEALPQIIRLLDSRHWLILTTRAHLLNLAKLSLDIATTQKRFPLDGEVIVQADRLNEAEKGRILYRHAKEQRFPDEIRRRLKAFAQNIVRDPHFTPERIRRLVAESLPRVLRAGDSSFGHAAFGALIRGALEEPTRQMSISFRNLRAAEKWLLFALVEVESTEGVGEERLTELASAYERLCPAEQHEPFDEVIAAMSDAFLRQEAQHGLVGWVHPSCRDLAISELARNARVRRRFLVQCGFGGLGLAMSIGGGARGGIECPLLVAEGDWEVFIARTTADYGVAKRAVVVAAATCEAAAASGSAGSRIDRLRGVLHRALWPRVIEALNSEGWDRKLLALYCESGAIAHVGVPIDLNATWDEQAMCAMREARSSSVIWQRGSDFGTLAGTAKLICGFGLPKPERFDRDLATLTDTWIELIEDERTSSYDESDWSARDRSEAAQGYSELAETLEELEQAGLSEERVESIRDGRSYFEAESERLTPEEPDYERDDDRFEDGPDVSVHELFKDL